ncbi:MAG: clostripain-related cysteine peptidase [Vulcanimicrobiota bacterium]
MNTTNSIQSAGSYYPDREISSPQAPKVHVTAHLDATEGVVEPFIAGRIDEFEKLKGETSDSLEADVQIYRAGVTPGQKIKKGLGIFAAHIALPVAGFFLGGPVGLGIGLMIDAGLFAAGTTRDGIGNFFSGIEHRKAFPEPDWKGKRTYEITADSSPRFDSKLISSEPEGKIDSEDFATYLAGEMKKYPSSTKEVLFLGGHGLGYRQIAGMKSSELASALHDAEMQSGKKPDVILMESCLMSNIEALSGLKDRAGIAVVSEETLGATTLPLKELLNDAVSQGGTPEEIGKRMVDIAGKTGQIQTLAAIDLGKVQLLTDSMNTLGNCLSEELKNGNQKEIQNATKKAMRFPKGKMMFLERSVLKFSDLGGFMKALSGKKLSHETKASINDVQKAMDQVIVAKYTSNDYSEASGISFQSKPGILMDASPDLQKYDDTDMPDGWKDFIDTLWKKRPNNA